MLLVQFKDDREQRRVGVLDTATHTIRVLDGYQSTYALAQAAPASSPSGFTKATDRSCAPANKPWRCPNFRLTVARSLRSQACM